VRITFNRNNAITFADGQPVKTVDETIYLGTQFNKRVDPKTEIIWRISQTTPILKKLDMFWKQAQVSNKWKIQVFKAWKHCNPQRPRKLNWTRFNRKVSGNFKMSTTYIDRTNTNQEYRRANLEMGEGANGIIRPSSDILRDKRRKLLGHIIRRPRDPQHQATFATRTLLPQQVEHRRVGRPRAAWTYETMTDCWLKHNEHIPFEIQSREHNEQIKTWAFNREAPL